MTRAWIGLPAAPDGYYFASFRAALGSYLLIHFVTLMPYAEEVYGRSGMLPDARLNPTAAFIPPVPWIFDSPAAVHVLLGALSGVAAFLALGVMRHVAAFALWLGLVVLLQRNNLTSNVSLPYVGWMLLATLAVPRGEGWTQRATSIEWKFPPQLIVGAWILFGVSYSFAGLAKLLAPEWRDGSALLHIAQQPITYAPASSTLQALPEWVMRAGTWSAVALEVSCAPLALLTGTRRFIWFGLTCMQLFVLVTMQITEVTVGMLLFHALLFDRGWLQKTDAPILNRSSGQPCVGSELEEGDSFLNLRSPVD